MDNFTTGSRLDLLGAKMINSLKVSYLPVFLGTSPLPINQAKFDPRLDAFDSHRCYKPKFSMFFQNNFEVIPKNKGNEIQNIINSVV